MSHAGPSPLARAVATAGRAYPLMSGCGKIANLLPLRLLARATPSVVRAQLRDGSCLHVDVDDYLGRTVFYFGDYDPKVSWALRRVLRPGDTVIDIGANIGLVSLQAARLVGSGGRVEAFEPQPALAEHVRNAAAANTYEHLTVHSLALSDRDATMRLVVPKNNTGCATLERGSDGVAIDVAARVAGDMLDELKLHRARLMKIDVEGYEASVIRGALSFIREAGPDAVLCEELATPAADQPSLRMLADAGYDVFAVPKAMLRVRLVTLDDPTASGAHDFLAVRRDRTRDAVLDRLLP